jgi:Carboxypeptidase regulatory-like domain
MVRLLTTRHWAPVFSSALLAVMIGGMHGLLLAQGLTGQISGTVLDRDGKPVGLARVALINSSTGQTREILTGEEGQFLFTGLLPGGFIVKAGKPGFSGLRRDGIDLSAGGRLVLDPLVLEVGAVSESVSVTASTESLQTESSERAGLVDSHQLQELSLKGRDFMGMLQTLSGVVDTNFSSREAPGSSSLQGLYFNGNRQGALGLTLDGIFAMDTGGGTGPFLEPSIDAVAEVKVLLTNYQAEYGRSAGGIINTVIKNGTKDFHGGAYYYFRNEALNANEFFNNRQGLARPLYRYNYPGYFLGGPVLFPGTGFNRRRERLFFFWSQEFLARAYPTPLTFQTFPTASERAGDFSKSIGQNGKLIALTDPLTHAPFPGNIVPANRIDPNGQILLGVFPQPNANDPTHTYNYAFQSGITQPRNDSILRMDWSISPKNQFYARGIRDYEAKKGGYGFTLASLSWPQLPIDIEFHSVGFVSTWIHTFRPSSVNELTFGVNRGTQSVQPPSAEGLAANSRTALHLNLPQFFPQANPYHLIPNATFAGVSDPPQFNIDQRYPYFGPDNVWNYFDNYSEVRGAHNLKAGFFVERSATNRQLASAFNGVIAFDRDANNPLDTGYAFSNALIGTVDSYTESSQHPVGHGRDLNVEWYVQDTWRAAKRFTIDAGLRFYYLRATVTGGTPLAAFDQSLYSASKQPPLIQPYLDPSTGIRSGRDPVTGQILPAVYIGTFSPAAGTPNQGMRIYDGAIMKTPPIQVAPRLGFSWDVLGNGSTAVRGGIGIFYDRFPDNQVMQFAQSPPLVVSPAIYYTSLAALLGSQLTASPNSVYGMQTNWKPPAVYNWSFGVQRKLFLGAVLDVAWVGNLTRHQMQIRDLNATAYGTNFLPSSIDATVTGNKPLPVNFLRPIPGYASIQYYEFASNSNFNALEVQLNRRLSRKLTFGLNYTWSKVLDVADTPLSTVNPGLDYRKYDYGVASFDRRQKLTVNFVYGLPQASHYWNNALARRALDGWEVSSILTFITGPPAPINYAFVTATDVTGASGVGIETRVNLSCNPNSGATGDTQFNTSCAQAPTKAQFGIGGASRFPITGPGVENVDLSLYKNLPFGASETRRLQFRLETFNTLNHAQFTTFDNTARFDASGSQTNLSLGHFTAAAPARRIAVGLKLYF